MAGTVVCTSTVYNVQGVYNVQCYVDRTYTVCSTLYRGGGGAVGGSKLLTSSPRSKHQFKVLLSQQAFWPNISLKCCYPNRHSGTVKREVTYGQYCV